MSPRRPHLRNRKRIKAPRRFEDADVITSSPRQESHEESEASSELEEEIYQSPKPKKPKPKPRAYHGQVIEFNPNLPPAAFPTLDYPDYVHNGGNVPIDLESHLSGLQSQEPELVDSEEITPFTSGRSCHREKIVLIGNHPTMTSTTADSALPGSQIVTQTSIKAQKQRRANIPTSIYGESTDNGPRNPIWASNMARMEEAGRMNDLARNILEMAPSSEEDEAEEDVAMEDAAGRPTKLARTDSIPELPAWDDLTVAHKLDLADAVAEFYPDPRQVMHQLRLSLSQKKELVELLIQRQERAAKEKANQQRLQEQTRDALLQGKRLSQPTFHQMVEENLYEDISEDDHLRTSFKELKKARAYLKYCGFDPALADEIWDVPPMLSAARPARPAQSKPKASLTSTAAQTPPRLSEGPFSRRPALLTPQQYSYPPDPRLGLLQQQTQGAMPQHRPTPAQALIAQHSPAAPLSKVPLQSFRIPPGNGNGGLSARSQGRAGVQQPTRPALPTGPRVTRPALPQEEHSLPAGSHSPTPRRLPSEPRNQERQSGGNPNGGAAASQGTGGVVEDQDSVNKKKRKKSGI